MKTRMQIHSASPTNDVAYERVMIVNEATSARSAMRGVRKELLPIERHVLSLLANGLSTKRMLDHVEIGEDMVITHIKYMFAISGVNSRPALVAWAFRSGLLT
jgi:DNA-binding CsgD family transcriptional regulator